MISLVQHLANQPAAGVLICLVLAIAMFVVAGVLSFMEKAFWAMLVCAGLALFALAFLIT